MWTNCTPRFIRKRLLMLSMRGLVKVHGVDGVYIIVGGYKLWSWLGPFHRRPSHIINVWFRRVNDLKRGGPFWKFNILQLGKRRFICFRTFSHQLKEEIKATVPLHFGVNSIWFFMSPSLCQKSKEYCATAKCITNYALDWNCGHFSFVPAFWWWKKT